MSDVTTNRDTVGALLEFDRVLNFTARAAVPVEASQ